MAFHSCTIFFTSEDCNRFNFFLQVFTGNTDRNTVVSHVLLQPITARYVKIRPTAWEGRISMRAEFYGCVLSGAGVFLLIELSVYFC